MLKQKTQIYIEHSSFIHTVLKPEAMLLSLVLKNKCWHQIFM